MSLPDPDETSQIRVRVAQGLLAVPHLTRPLCPFPGSSDLMITIIPCTIPLCYLRVNGTRQGKG